MKRTFLIFLMVLFIASIAPCAKASDGTVWASVCQVRTRDHQLGTGVCFLEDETHSYFVTNAHVLIPEGGTIPDTRPSVFLWRDGHMSSAMGGDVLSANTDVDIAIFRVDTRNWGDYRPIPLPFVDDVPIGTPLYVLGCPNGTWPTMAEGRRILAAGEGVAFVPPPAGGRSGGPLLLRDGSGIVGIVTYRIGETLDTGQEIATHGLAIASRTVCWVLKGGRSAVQYGGECGPYGCPPDNGREFNFLSPDIHRGDSYQSPPPNSTVPPFPTLPTTGPGIVQTDFADLQARIAALETLPNRVTNLENLPNRVMAIESALSAASIDVASVAENAETAADAANVAAERADSALLLAEDTKNAQEELPGLLEDVKENAESGALIAVKALLTKFGFIGGGAIALAFVIFWNLIGKKYAVKVGDRLDGNPDQRFDPRGAYHNAREFIDRRDRHIDWTYPAGYGPYDPSSIAKYGPPPGADPSLYGGASVPPQPQQPMPQPPQTPQPPQAQ